MKKSSLNSIYKTLLRSLGPQGWWPVYSLRMGRSEYRGRPPKNALELFEVAAGAILTQNVAWINAEKGIGALKSAGYLNPEGILNLDSSSLGGMIRPTGYYNQKAVKLKIFSEWFLSRGKSISAFKKKSPESLRADLLSVKGIGPETADSILLYGLNMKIFVVDAYTKRIFSRLGFFSDRALYHEMQDLFHKKFRGTVDDYNEFHALIVALGKDICRNKPLCGLCVLKKVCGSVSIYSA